MGGSFRFLVVGWWWSGFGFVVLGVGCFLGCGCWCLVVLGGCCVFRSSFFVEEFLIFILFWISLGVW